MQRSTHLSTLAVSPGSAPGAASAEIPALSYLWYPLFLAVAIATFGGLLAAGVAPVLAAYPPVLFVGLGIVMLERYFPERDSWRPRAADVRADAAFMTVVQIVVPRGLAALVALLGATWMHANMPGWLWPHGWPLAIQIIALVLAVDFLRYWLHRACHSYPGLWRLHEVHHSPDILYVLNVARFHPFEKALHFSLDTVPFVLLGVAPEVIAGYFLLYSANGLFQHSNVRLRHGWLNYVIASAEMHRWHHARDPKVAWCNFSNTTIVWDLVFRTWYLPKDVPVERIGIVDRTYPKSFLGQMVAPFRRRNGRPPRTPKAWLADMLVTLRLYWTRLVEAPRIAAIARDPMRAQRKVLMHLLHKNRNTTFGLQHAFAEIGDPAAFVQHVPVRDYEGLRPFIDAEINLGEMALTVERPSHYARTSGTTGSPKDIPLTGSHLAASRRIHQRQVAFHHRTCPQAFAGGILGLVSPTYEGVLANGKPFGSASGIVASNTPALVLEKFVVPFAVLGVSDSRVKYLLILRLALARPDVTCLGAANSTTILALMKLYREHQADLIEDLRRGAFFLADRLSPEVLVAVQSRLGANPDRADELDRLRLSGVVPRLADLLPQLRMIVTWTCAGPGVTVDAVRKEIAPRTHIQELGYISSEFHGTITIGRRSGSGLPTIDSHFFEFVERDQWDAGQPEFLTIDRIRKGVDYYLIVTTAAGLYRYFINDLVQVTGFLHKVPLLKFLQKGKGVTNMTGEKLYEAQVLSAVRASLSAMGRSVRFVMMLADESACRYRLFVEADAGPKDDAAELAESVDARLAELNIEYQAKRESARLGALDARWLAAGTGEAYKQDCVNRGQREGQFKSLALTNYKGFEFDLEACVEPA